MIGGDAGILFHLLRGQRREGTHAERLQAFYAPQAARYDAFRERLLQGRRELIESVELQPGARVVELGGGTGRNLSFFGERLAACAEVTLVDLCPALLEQARRRTAGLPNVSLVEADATTWQPPQPVDLVYFSYALSMIPDWRAAIDNALAMLAPGGTLAVVDFHVSGSAPAPGRLRHGAFTRNFWPRWFAHDGVRVDPETLAYLDRRLPHNRCHECRAKVPYLLGLSVPYFRFTASLPGPGRAGPLPSAV